MKYTKQFKSLFSYCCLSLAIICLATVHSASATDCYQVYKSVQLKLLKNPRFGNSSQFCLGAEKVVFGGNASANSGEGKSSVSNETCPLCQPAVRKKAIAEGWTYISAEGHPDAPQGVQVIIEVLALEHQIIYLLREGVYYGEFIDQTFTHAGGHKRDVMLILKELPAAKIDRTTLSNFEYYQGASSYIWSDQKVEKVERRHQLVKLKADGSILSRAKDWRKTTATRRLVNLNLVYQSREEAQALLREKIIVESYFHDPIFNKLFLYRRFPMNKLAHLTVLQFVDLPGTDEGFAQLRFIRNGRELEMLRVTDPGRNYVTIDARLLGSSPRRARGLER